MSDVVTIDEIIRLTGEDFSKRTNLSSHPFGEGDFVLALDIIDDVPAFIVSLGERRFGPYAISDLIAHTMNVELIREHLEGEVRGIVESLRDDGAVH